MYVYMYIYIYTYEYIYLFIYTYIDIQNETTSPNPSNPSTLPRRGSRTSWRRTTSSAASASSCSSKTQVSLGGACCSCEQLGPFLGVSRAVPKTVAPRGKPHGKTGKPGEGLKNGLRKVGYEKKSELLEDLENVDGAKHIWKFEKKECFGSKNGPQN